MGGKGTKETLLRDGGETGVPEPLGSSHRRTRRAVHGSPTGGKGQDFPSCWSLAAPRKWWGGRAGAPEPRDVVFSSAAGLRACPAEAKGKEELGCGQGEEDMGKLGASWCQCCGESSGCCAPVASLTLARGNCSAPSPAAASCPIPAKDAAVGEAPGLCPQTAW